MNNNYIFAFQNLKALILNTKQKIIFKMKKKYTVFLKILSVISLIILFFCAAELTEPSWFAKGYILNKPLETTVDCELAKLMIVDTQHLSVKLLFEKYKNKPLSTQTLAEIYFEHSADVATFYFVQRAYQLPENRKTQDLYHFYIKQLQQDKSTDALKQLKNYYIVFIPGLGYKDFPGTGAHFKRQRKLLNAYGIPNELIITKQWGVIDDNANIIVKRLQILCQQHNNIILVSSSKSGLETAIVLGEKLKPEETTHIKAWISVAGILRGSPVADYFLTPSKNFISKTFLFTKGKTLDMLESMSYRDRRKSFDELVFPQHIQIIHYVGAPLATKIRPKIKNRYLYMLPLGPNDGFTPLADQICNQGRVVTEVGLDHFFDDPDIDIKALALALTGMKLAEENNHTDARLSKD